MCLSGFFLPLTPSALNTAGILLNFSMNQDNSNFVSSTEGLRRSLEWASDLLMSGSNLSCIFGACPRPWKILLASTGQEFWTTVTHSDNTETTSQQCSGSVLWGLLTLHMIDSGDPVWVCWCFMFEVAEGIFAALCNILFIFSYIHSTCTYN